MDTSTVQRKIELQASEDLTYLLANVRRRAQVHLDEAFPAMEGSAGGEDELRSQIEYYVNEYINTTFSHAAPNLSINGMPAESSTFLNSSSLSNPDTALEPQVEYEPWDGRLRHRVEDLARQEEELLNEIAALKSRVPAAVAAEYAERVKDALKRDEEALQERKRMAIEAGGNGEGEEMVGLELGELVRQREVEGAYRGAVEGLGRVKREMPATVAKMERARVAGEYVVTERR